MGIVVLKATFRTDSKGVVFPDAEPIPLQENDEETPFGALEGDYAIVKPHADVAILGQAHAPQGKPVERMEVVFRLGEFRRKLVVLGDREWTGGVLSSKPSMPKPFTTMPVTYANAFGGVTRLHKEIEGPFHDNPYGKGYVTLPNEVAGTPLPNIEDPDGLIRKWDDKPTPAGFAPLPRTSALRGLRGIQADLDAQKTTCKPEWFSFGHPKMIVRKLPLGEEVSLEGMTPDGMWCFTLPLIRVGIEVSLGEKTTRLKANPDTLCIFPEEKRFFILFRKSYVYPFRKEQKRTTRILEINEKTAAEKFSDEHKTLQSAGQDPEDPTTLIPMIDEKILTISYEEFMDNYPLNEIIQNLPICAC